MRLTLYIERQKWISISENIWLYIFRQLYWPHLPAVVTNGC